MKSGWLIIGFESKHAQTWELLLKYEYNSGVYISLLLLHRGVSVPEFLWRRRESLSHSSLLLGLEKNTQIPHHNIWCWHLRKEYLSKEQSKASKGLCCVPELIPWKEHHCLLQVLKASGIFEPDSVLQSMRKHLWYSSDWPALTLPLSCPYQGQLASCLGPKFSHPWVPLEEDQKCH